MFSGIVEELGKVVSKKEISEGFRFRIQSNKIIKKLKVASSVCVNGVCHTVMARTKNTFEFISIHETLKKTNLGGVNVGDEVNLENSLVLGGEIGGHFVLGHVDDTGIVSSIKQVNSADKKSKNWEYRVNVAKKHEKFVIYVGSIALNGVSLTVAEVKKPSGKYFEIMVAIIPYTFDNTTFKNLRVGDKVNLEFDFLGKYALNAMNTRGGK